MKPFELEAALRGEPVVTRDGRPVSIGQYNPEGLPIFQLSGWVAGVGLYWDANGKVYGNEDNGDDLFMAEKPKVKKDGWVIMLYDNRIWVKADGTCVYDSRGDADQQVLFIGKKTCKVAKIEWEEDA